MVVERDMDQMKSFENYIRLGMIGGGVTSSIGWSHISAAQMDGYYKIEAGCFSREKENSYITAKKWNIDPERIYTSVEKLISNEKESVDAVSILTPTPNHLSDFERLARAGIPIICEKPLASCTEDASAMKKILSQNNGFAAVTFNYSGYPMIRELRELIASGEIGEILHVHIEMPQEFFLKLDPLTNKLTEPKGWRLKDEVIPTICLDLGVHLHHLSWFLTGLKINKVNASMSKSIIHPEIVDDVMMWVEYENHAKGAFWFSKSALGHRNGLKIRIYGTKASAVWKHENPEFLSIGLNTGESKILDRGSNTKIAKDARYNRYRPGHPSGFIEAFANVYHDIFKALMCYKRKSTCEDEYVYGIDHSIEGLQLFERAVESNISGTWKDV